MGPRDGPLGRCVGAALSGGNSVEVGGGGRGTGVGGGDGVCSARTDPTTVFAGDIISEHSTRPLDR